MEILWFNLAAVYVSSVFARYFHTSKIKRAPYVIPNKLWIILVMTVLVVVSGLRKNIGDTFFYMHDYDIKKYQWSDLSLNSDFGFDIFQMMLQKITSDPQILIFVSAMITNIFIVGVLFKYSRMIELSLYVYITAGSFLVSMNGIRQFIAASIIFTATKYLMNGNWKKYMMFVLLAASFHKSALILVPIYWIVRTKAWSKITILLIFGAVIIVIGFNQFSSILFSAIENTQYGRYADFHEGGANILRVLVTAVPLLIAYFGREKLKMIFPDSDCVVNMSVISLIFMMISTQNWIFARFEIYFGLYHIILISWIVKLFRKPDQKFIYYSIIVCYFIFFYFEQVITLGIEYKSNYL
ncbi:EpsG family protein [Falsibacillus albus]|uniref:EpsG family protein n=1 Tax=Falsibacillus albus TaxID=2478915 RepID=A0A3L7K0I6_9BACI|nr:EpsG family protein [Falsibacillus albus]RLQ96280.1 EpsG family protein [Falsibacillus albus]